MKEYCFDVVIHCRTDAIHAETEEEARDIAYGEFDFCGEEYDVTMECLYEEDIEE